MISWACGGEEADPDLAQVVGQDLWTTRRAREERRQMDQATVQGLLHDVAAQIGRLHVVDGENTREAADIARRVADRVEALAQALAGRVDDVHQPHPEPITDAIALLRRATELLHIARRAASKLETMYIRREVERRCELDNLIAIQRDIAALRDAIREYSGPPAGRAE